MLTRLAQSLFYQNAASDGGDGVGASGVNNAGSAAGSDKTVGDKSRSDEGKSQSKMYSENDLKTAKDSIAASVRKATELDLKKRYESDDYRNQIIDQFMKQNNLTPDALEKHRATLSEAEVLRSKLNKLENVTQEKDRQIAELQSYKVRTNIEDLLRKHDANDPKNAFKILSYDYNLNDLKDDEYEKVVIKFMNENSNYRNPEATGGAGSGRGAGAGPPEKADMTKPENRIAALKQGRAKGMW